MLNKVMPLVILLSLLFGFAFAEMQNPGILPKTIDQPKGAMLSPQRTAPAYTFSRTPVSLLTSYFDYMIGSYNGLPLRVIPESAGGGYFLTYHGKTSATATRRVYYAYLSDTGNVINNSTITLANNREGYPTLAVDPVSGKPLYAWHANADADAQLEVQFVTDAFISGIDGLWNELHVPINNPITITLPTGLSTIDNEFIWPTAVIGPSPVPNKRRVYVWGRNSVTHNLQASPIPVENAYIAYADFSGYDIENGNTLAWSYTSIPEQNIWNSAQLEARRPNDVLVCDTAGNLYMIGYHSSWDASGVYLDEPDVEVFKCTAYGAGTWTHHTYTSNIPTWNPPASPGGAGFFTDSDNNDIPWTNAQLSWGITNSSHLNATIDNDGKIHVPALWGYKATNGSYYPNMQFMKEMVFDTNNNNFSIKDIYPQQDLSDNYNQTFTPWDMDAPFGVVDEYITDDTGAQYPSMATDWNFPYWDQDSHITNGNPSMMFHLSNMKVTEANSQGMMAVVWQNSYRAKLFNEYADPDYAAYANTPEIYISISSNNGFTWSEPIILNNVDTPQFSGIKPMFVYPADKVKYIGMQGDQMVGKLGLMFYDDNTWGSNGIAPNEFANDGGRVMFTELQIVFGNGTPPPPVDPFGTPVVLSGSMSLMAGVMINGAQAANGDVVAAFVSVAGVPQLRGKGTVAINGGTAACLMQIFTESNGENISFKVWDASTDEVLNITETLASQINGIVGEWPNNLYWLHANHATTQNINLTPGWNMISLNVHPANMDISSIFASVLSNVQMLKNSDGVYVPNNPFNTLNTLSDGKGYYVSVSQACTLQIMGTAINTSTSIPLAAGWNLAAFTPQSAISVSAALASIASSIIQVKGTEGIYVPNNPYNTLTTLSPGRAYWIKLSSAASLVYPSSGKAAPQDLLPACNIWGTPVIKTDSQVVLSKLDNNAQAGDILGAFVNDELRGLSTVISVDGILGAMLQVFTEEAGEQILFKLYSPNSNILYSMNSSLSSAPGETIGDYANGEYYSLKTDQSSTPALISSITSAYPNPFKDGTSIALNVAKDAPTVQIEIYNLRGQRVKTLFHGQLDPGMQKLWWNGIDEHGDHVASGVYFCRMNSGNTAQSIKLMILK
ncbi:MAG: T9SS type A sorting domain-containing protein [Candidatus Cloacimonetes bacterium]|nr:T9SS type A sorting domain-containing protein [Candidatus Cloacimonadota bacterium]